MADSQKENKPHAAPTGCEITPVAVEKPPALNAAASSHEPGSCDAWPQARDGKHLVPLRQFLSRQLPPLREYTSRTSSSGKKPTTPCLSDRALKLSKLPLLVAPWTSFADDVEKRLKESPNVLVEEYPQIPSLRVGSEADIARELDYHLFGPLESIPDIAKAEGAFKPTSEISGKADKVYCELKPTTDFSAGDSPEAKLIAFEFKWHKALENMDDLIEWTLPCQNAVYNHDLAASLPTEKYNAVKALFQLVGYMDFYKLSFGVLSTYAKSWFLARDKAEPGIILISPAVLFDQQSPSLAGGVYYAVTEARRRGPCPVIPGYDSPTKSVGDPDEDDENSGGKKRRKRTKRADDPDFKSKHKPSASNSSVTTRLQSKNPPQSRQNDVFAPLSLKSSDFELGQVIGQGRTGLVAKGFFRAKPVVMKIVSTYADPEAVHELENEARIYDSLAHLQGSVVPKVICYADFFGMFRLLIFESNDAVALSATSSPLPAGIKREIFRGLEKLHARGVLHNDIRPENVLIYTCGARQHIFFIDFAFSKLSSDRAKFSQESALLLRVLDGLH